MTCVGTEELRVDGVELDAIDAAARLAVAGLKIDEVVVVYVPVSKAACRGDGVAAAFLARRGLALVRQLERRRQVLGELN